MINAALLSYTSFNGLLRIAAGDLPTNALAVKHALTAGASGPLLTFCDQTGGVIDLDTRGSDAEMLARLSTVNDPAPQALSELADADGTSEPRGRGRPKLGVVAREVTLLPRHWDWLATQPGGASITLRKLVEEALRANESRDRQRRTTERTYRAMSAIAGDLAGFEEASRALFANDVAKFHQQTETWPHDVRDYIRLLADDCQSAP